MWFKKEAYLKRRKQRSGVTELADAIAEKRFVLGENSHFGPPYNYSTNSLLKRLPHIARS
jgi:hypothetical protein